MIKQLFNKNHRPIIYCSKSNSMFGRNNNTFPTPYTHSPNNGTIFNSNAFQQTNMFNFQIQNQTFNYNYNQLAQHFPNQIPLINLI